MDIRYFKHFLAVADELHFGRAAARLNMEQAPLSQSIQRLEAWLGVALFDRSPRGGTKLTRAGRALFEEARRTVDQFDRSVSIARRSGGSREEPVAIGFVTAGVLRLLPLALKEFRRKFADVRIQLLEASTKDLLAAVEADRLDIALVHPVESTPPGVLVEELRRDRPIVALSKSHPLSARRVLALKDLANEPLIFFPRSASPVLYKRFLDLYRTHGIKPRIEQEARLTPTILSLVSAGMGYSLVPESAAFLPFPDVVFKPVEDIPPDLAWRLSVAWKPGTASSAAQAFMSTLRMVAEE